MKQTQFANENGFTLIEALVAMVVLTIGILSLMHLQSTLTRRNSTASHITIASTSATNEIEQIISTPFDDDLFNDDDGLNNGSNNGNGTNEDTDNDGLDDVGPEFTFGLDDLANADEQITSPDGKYTIYINVANNLPIEDSKTIRVHIQDNLGTMANIIHFDYIRQKSI